MAGRIGEAERAHMGSAARLAGPRAWLAMVAAVATMFGVPLGARAETTVASRADTSERVVALTFDDGWHPGRCEEIYDTLVRFGVPATWFPNAVYVRAVPALWRRIAERFPIGNHTTHHRALPNLPLRELRHEIRSDERHIESVTGRPMSKILRPPYGVYDRRVLREVGRLGYETIVLWDVAADDTSRRATDRQVAR
ncbi:MAG TPA: polysaccharide deacetylase family protein, partial [Candidatus Limnocylindrales bacterium]|nr:polysaccharide deacetylase family protein [Candidatus Limnocylindrales bacterium]